MTNEVSVLMDDETVQKFRAFCLMLQVAPPGDWVLTKIQSYPNGNVTIHLKIVPNLTSVINKNDN